MNLLTVVLHEFGHGLGFLSLANPSTGDFEQNEPDIWSYYLYDEGSGQHWVDMSAGMRAASAISSGLAWDGPTVTAAVPETLTFPPLVRVTSAPDTPSAVKDYDQISTAQFSGPIPVDGGVSGSLAMGSTQWGCTALGRLDPLDGKIAILDRGGPNADAGCTFVEKARNAQDAGAIGLLVANNTSNPELITRSGTAPDVAIPVLLMTQTDGTALKSAVAAGPVRASIIRDEGKGYSGADPAHRALLYSPTALEAGSSVSHWDTSAFPNLLMEPMINPDLTHSLDLTVSLLHDIGWTLSDGGTSVDAGICASPGGGGGNADAGGGGGGAGGSGSGCTAALGPPAPWLALLGLVALARRRRRA